MNARTWRMGAVLVLLVSLIAMAGWGQGVVPKGIIPTPPESALEVSVWVDRGVYSVGDSITIRYSVNEACYVYICDIQSDGQWAPAFPNSFPGGSDNYVTAGEHTVPGTWSVSPPLGTEYLQIIATRSPVDPFSLTTGDAAALLTQIQTQILDVLPAADCAWNFTSFEIVAGSSTAYGRLNISSTPPGASIYVDNIYVGFAPRTTYARPGNRDVTISLAGYQTKLYRIYVIGGFTRTISATLVPTTPVNSPPVSTFTYAAGPGTWISFDGSASHDPDGSIASYSWNFGDGGSGTGAAVWHQYASPGTYAVTLTVADNGGATASSNQTVHVGPANQSPVAAFVPNPSTGTPGSWIQFDASTSTDVDGFIVSYAWNYGDGHTSSVGPVDFWAYASAGTYSVTLTVTDNQSATSSVTHVVQVGPLNVSPTASFTPPAAVAAVPARFDGSTSTDPDGWIVSYQWSFGDGATATGNIVYHPFALPGTYSVTLTVQDNGGATNSTTQPVVVSAPFHAPVAAFTYSPPSPVVGSPVVFNASTSYDPDGTIVSYQWDLNGDGTIDASGVTTQVIYSSPGTGTVRLTVTDNSALSATATQTITVSASGGSPSGAPAMGTTPGFFIWGSDSWHITVNAGAGWTTPHNFRIELRTDGQFSGVNEVWSGGVAPMGIIPTPSTSGKTVVFESSIQSGSVDYTFTIPGAKSMWLSLKLDSNGDGTLEESTSFVYLRAFMVHPPASPFVVGVPSGTTAPLVPSLNFCVGTAWVYTEMFKAISCSTLISTLESL